MHAVRGARAARHAAAAGGARHSAATLVSTRVQYLCVTFRLAEDDALPRRRCACRSARVRASECCGADGRPHHVSFV